MSDQTPENTPAETTGTPEGAPPATDSGTTPPVKKATRPRKKAAAKATAPAPSEGPSAPTDAAGAGSAGETSADAGAAAPAPVKKTTRPRKKAAAKKTAPADGGETQLPPQAPVEAPTEPTDEAAPPAAPMVVFQAPEKPAQTRTTTRSRTRKTAVAAPDQAPAAEADQPAAAGDAAEAPAVADAPARPRKTAARSGAKKRDAAADKDTADDRAHDTANAAADAAQDADEGDAKAGAKSGSRSGSKSGGKGGGKGGAKGAKKTAAGTAEDDAEQDEQDADTADLDAAEERTGEGQQDDQEEHQGEGGARRRSRRRGGRRRRKGSGGGDDADRDEAGEGDAEAAPTDDEGDDQNGGDGSSKRRRTRTRTPKSPEDEIASVSGSTRLEAKKQRRREGREAGRRRAPIVSEAEFLARRESVDRLMVIRQRGDLTQIAVLEDKVLVEHYVSRESQTSLIGNVYLGRVQNVLPSMEAAFIDIGKGRNAVLYAGEVNWSAVGHKEGEPRKIESVLQSGQTILVQVTKDPIGHKGARLTGQISLPGRFLVYVPDGTTSGISRKLPDTERNRLKTLLKQIVPETAGVIVRTAAEGASEDELTQDVERLTARWQDIEAKVRAGRSPELLYGEPDLTLKVVRDLFTEDFSRLVVEGDEAWDLVDGYVAHVAPDLRERLERYQAEGDGDADVFTSYRIDEQIAKALDRKVWLPSGGSLVIDRTEAMTVVDVNTGKFTGSGGNLEETVTKNNLEAAEEIVRQLRLRDIGGIIVVDFIDMVLESNRDLVLRRLVECLGRDRTRHQVAEVTSLGLVQMTRKRIGTGLLEAFSEECSHCKGRGLVVHDHPIETAGSSAADDEPRRRRSGRGGRGRNDEPKPEPTKPSPKDLAAMRPQGATADSGDVDGEQHPTDSGAAPETTPDTTPADEAGDETGREAKGSGSGARSRNRSTRSRRDGARTEAPGADRAERPVRDETVQDETAQDGSAQNGSAQEGAPEVEPSPVESSDAAQVEDSTQEAVDHGAAESAVEIPAPPAPVVVTTRRRRTATRPAGPPAGAPAQSGPGAPAGDRPDEVLDEAGQVIPHVPVKKKGSRKR